MKYLTVEDVLQMHSFILDETSGRHGVRDLAALKSLEALPQQSAFGKELYGTIFLKAAVYLRNVIMGHPFIDGNKRTGMTAAIIFLEDNGHMFRAEPGDIEMFALRVVKESLDLEAITSWLADHCIKKHYS